MHKRSTRKSPKEGSSNLLVLPETQQQSSQMMAAAAAAASSLLPKQQRTKRRRRKLQPFHLLSRFRRTSSSRPHLAVALVFVSALGVCLWMAFFKLYRSLPTAASSIGSSRRIMRDRRGLSIPETIVFSSSPHDSHNAAAAATVKVPVRLPRPLQDDDIPRAPDFGDLTHLMIYMDEGMSRVLHRDLEGERGFSKDDEEEKSEKGWFDYIYAFDDDYERNPLQLWEDDKIQDEKTCRRISWHRRNPMDCNSMHEFDLFDLTRKSRTNYLSHGAFRDVFLVGKKQDNDLIIFKQYRYDTKYDHEDFEYMRMDTLVSEMFTSSPLYVDIYGACGLSALMEAMPDGAVEDVAIPLQEERFAISLDDENDVDPKNNMTVTQKITFALEMAEALSLMHNYPGGVIVHDDVHLEQFLLTPDHEHVKIQDFNRAEIMLWNEEDEEYCGYLNGPGHGEWRSPEEYADNPLNEKIDVYSLGTNMYAMLTGLLPFYDTESSKSVKSKIKHCKTSYIDPRYRERSLAERKLVDAIERCWECDADKRIDIGGVVEILREGLTGDDDTKEQGDDSSTSNDGEE